MLPLPGLHGSPQQCGYMVITPASEKPEDIDIDRAIESEKRAEALLAEHAANLDETRARASLERALRRIDVARKYGKH